MGRTRPSHIRKKSRDVSRGQRTRARKKDLDQIEEELKPENLQRNRERFEPDVDLPGMGLYHCIHCSRHFIDQDAKQVHMKSKLHKKRIKALKQPAFTIKEAELAGGLKTNNDRSLHRKIAERALTA